MNCDLIYRRIVSGKNDTSDAGAALELYLTGIAGALNPCFLTRAKEDDCRVVIINCCPADKYAAKSEAQTLLDDPAIRAHFRALSLEDDPPVVTQARATSTSSRGVSSSPGTADSATPALSSSEDVKRGQLNAASYAATSLFSKGSPTRASNNLLPPRVVEYLRKHWSSNKHKGGQPPDIHEAARAYVDLYAKGGPRDFYLYFFGVDDYLEIYAHDHSNFDIVPFFAPVIKRVEEAIKLAVVVAKGPQGRKPPSLVGQVSKPSLAQVCEKSSLADHAEAFVDIEAQIGEKGPSFVDPKAQDQAAQEDKTLERHEQHEEQAQAQRGHEGNLETTSSTGGTTSTRILINCRQGINRSGACLCAALLFLLERHPDKAVIPPELYARRHQDRRQTDEYVDRVIQYMRGKRHPRYEGELVLSNAQFVEQLKEWFYGTFHIAAERTVK
ncbi:unnamed protein product [Amoebophrya sp. A25]|nr:unnamed protein product [Amoebophrya sp. A25]|eukprot:GSA25T00027208001.1